jgi:anti-anti-sigma factor
VETNEGITVGRPTDGVVVVSFAEEHDLATSDGISELLDGLVRENDLVIADFSQALFVDSSTLRVVVGAHRLAIDRGTSFTVQLDDGCAVRRTFELSGLLKEIAWASSRAGALDGRDGDGTGASDA